jgi:serine phosphatase RsbU (regulator of sigma subunit)/anti-sigma regulatory factor (Ser/Thr protein kinase)
LSTNGRPTWSSTTVELPADPRSPALARRHLESVLRGGPHAAVLDDALLLVTEMVTNTIVHAGTPARLSIDTTERSVLRLEVSDLSPTTVPVLQPQPSASTSGRGLHLLNALATSWGTVHTATEKSVWCTLGDPRPRRTHDAFLPVAVDLDTAPSRRDAATETEQLRWLLMLDTAVPADLGAEPLVAESVHRLCDAVGVESAVLLECRSDRPGYHRVLVERGPALPEDIRSAAVASAERVGAAASSVANVQSFRVALSADLLAVLVIAGNLDKADAIAAQLTCWRLANILSEQRLTSSAERARANAALLAEASELFAGILDAELSLNLATQLVVPRFGAWAAVWTFADGETVLSAVTHCIEDSVQPLRQALGTDETNAFVRRVSRRLHGDRSSLIAATDLPPVLRAVGAGEVLAVSLVARGRLLAMMLVATSDSDSRTIAGSDPASFDADSVAMVLEVATRAAVGADVALLFKDQHDVADALQTSLLPPDLPFDATLEFGARYVAAGETNTVGGDFYDVFALDDGRWVVLVGDVCGRGPEAAAITGLARSVLRVCLREGLTGPEAYDRLNREILELGRRGRFCTSALTILRPAPDHTAVSVTLAGHPLPVLAKADGRATTIGVPGTLVGVEPELSLHQYELALSPGDAIVLYTDGVTERRRGDAMFEEAGLLAAVRASIGKSAAGLAADVERTVSDFSSETSRDDLAVVVVRHLARSVTPTAPALVHALGR